MKFLKSLYLFILLISPVIIFHELGHLILGIILGFSPHTFSLGFGPKLWEINFWEINWVVSAVPLGGYVEFPENLLTNSLDHKKWFLVAIIGPFFNFLYSIVLMFLYLFLLFNKIEILRVYKKDLLGNIIIDKENYFLKIKLKEVSSFFSKRLIKGLVIKENDLSIEDDTDVFHEGSVLKELTLKDKLKWSLKLTWNHFFIKSLFVKSFIKTSAISHDKELNREGWLGPIGIGQLASWARSHSWAFFTLMSINLSWSLGWFNLIPLSFLDGGQALKSLLAIFNLGTESNMLIYQLLSLIILVLLLSLGILSDLFSFRKRK